MENKPIGFANGDGGTGRGAKMVRERIFGSFPMIEVPVTVEARLDTNDGCLTDALNAFRECGAGFKNSTASNDPRMIERRMISANIRMRAEAGVYAILRALQGPGRYERSCGVLRLATGGFYDERSCEQQLIDGKDVAVVTQHLDLLKLEMFATRAMRIAKAQGWHLVLLSKSTIAPSEQLFRERIEHLWKANGLKAGETRGGVWTGDFHHELTDIGLASLPIETAAGRTPFSRGNFLLVTDNMNGDSASDIIDHQHGNYVMGSKLFCVLDGLPFTYEELSTGTADDKATGPLTGRNFLSPAGIIFAMAAAIEAVNPHQRRFLDAVRGEMLAYLALTPPAERDTEAMIDQIAKRSLELIVA